MRESCRLAGELNDVVEAILSRIKTPWDLTRAALEYFPSPEDYFRKDLAWVAGRVLLWRFIASLWLHLSPSLSTQALTRAVPLIRERLAEYVDLLACYAASQKTETELKEEHFAASEDFYNATVEQAQESGRIRREFLERLFGRLDGLAQEQAVLLQSKLAN